MEKEIWKDIAEYEGLYKISSFGRVCSNHNRIKTKRRILNVQKNNLGYIHIILSKNGKCKTKLVHRLVAKAFIPNLQNKPEINHKDGNKENNHYKNLEWILHKQNLIHAVKILEIKFGRNEKPVIGINIKTGEKIRFKSLREAGRNGFITEAISMCCNKKEHYKTHYGYKWKFDS